TMLNPSMRRPGSGFRPDASIVRWPSVASPGSTCSTPIISNDYFPTLIEASGRKPEPGRRIDGLRIVPLVRGKEFPKRALYWDYPHYGNQGGAPGGVVREGRWKLIEWREDDAVELYDLDADPGETRNLAKTQADVTARLREMLANWRNDVGA